MSHLNETVLTLAQKEQLQKIILDPNNLPDLRAYKDLWSYPQILEKLNYHINNQIVLSRNH